MHCFVLESSYKIVIHVSAAKLEEADVDITVMFQ